MQKLLNPKITMMTTRSANSIDGRVVINGTEWVVAPFQIKSGASATEKENALIERAISESQISAFSRAAKAKLLKDGAKLNEFMDNLGE